jgi:hypothetical protein
LSARTLFLAFAGLLGAAGCAQPVQAPTEARVCWRLVTTAEKPAFRVISRGVANLESCAVQLEGARMMEGKPVTGAYQGRFIFADAEDVTSGASLKGQRFRVFTLKDKQEIQAGLQRLIELRKAGAPGA